MKKKIFLVLLLVTILVTVVFILTGCGNKKGGNKTNTTNKSNVQNNEKTTNTLTNNTTANNTKSEYDYKEGVLTEIIDEEGNPKQNDFVINGIILVGNRHEYSGLEADSEEVIEKLVKQGYKKEGINSSFYLNEYINFYMDTDYEGSADDVKIIVVPHKTVEEYEKLSVPRLTKLAEENGGFVMDYQKPDEENFKFVGENYVNMDYPEGKYDILFTYKGKLAYFISIDLTKEPIE